MAAIFHCGHFGFPARAVASGATGGRQGERSLLDGYCLQQGAGGPDLVFVGLPWQASLQTLDRE
jgi:hypothetical protein